MAKYKIGITEAGDAGLDLSWEDKLRNVDGAVLITKNITPGFIQSVIRNKEKLIVHATITGYGSTVVEPNVPCPEEAFAHLSDLVEQGFPKLKIVVRVDPIIPTQKGIEKACEIIRKCIDSGFYRFRVSIIDMYPHVRSRFIEKGIPLPYGERGFFPSKSQSEAVDNMLKSLIEYGKQKSKTCIQIEACAEPQLTNALQQGCISSQDLELLNLEDDVDNDNIGFQRRNCLCYSGKTELLTNKKRCPHQCLYCYWK